MTRFCSSLCSAKPEENKHKVTAMMTNSGQTLTSDEPAVNTKAEVEQTSLDDTSVPVIENKKDLILEEKPTIPKLEDVSISTDSLGSLDPTTLPVQEPVSSEVKEEDVEMTPPEVSTLAKPQHDNIIESTLRLPRNKLSGIFVPNMENAWVNIKTNKETGSIDVEISNTLGDKISVDGKTAAITETKQQVEQQEEGPRTSTDCISCSELKSQVESLQEQLAIANTNASTDVNSQQTVISPLEVEYDDVIETDFYFEWEKLASLKTNDKDVRCYLTTDKKTGRIVTFRMGNKQNKMVCGKIEARNYVDVRDVHTTDTTTSDHVLGGEV
jgi:hypothetical protein